jgi:flagellar hook protein FlgE
MDQALLAAVSGIDATQTYLDTIGNNIANVNTDGYKQQDVDFVDLLSEQLQGSSAPPSATDTGAGIDPLAVGAGVRVGAITSELSEGVLQQTGQNNDVAISGNGFLVADQGGEQVYTRNGQLSVDANGNLDTATGGLIQGWQAVNGQIDTNQPIGAITIPTGQVIPAKATTEVTMGGNLPAWSGTGTATPVTSTVTAYDSLGDAIPVTLTFTPVAGTANSWTMQATVGSGSSAQNLYATQPTIAFDPTSGQVASISGVTANTDGSYSVPVGSMPSGFSFPSGDNWDIDFPAGGLASSFTQFAGGSTAEAVNQNGAAAGTLTSWSIDSDGTIQGSFSNGQTATIGQIALANFANPGGLDSVGNLDFTATANSGQPEIGAPGSGGTGTLVGGSLESSNVNLADQLTDLVVAQEAYQANTKVVNTDSTVTQSLVQMA